MSERILSVGGKTKLYCPECGHPGMWDVYVGVSFQRDTAKHRRYCRACAWCGDVVSASILNSERAMLNSSFYSIVDHIQSEQDKS